MATCFMLAKQLGQNEDMSVTPNLVYSANCVLNDFLCLPCHRCRQPVAWSTELNSGCRGTWPWTWRSCRHRTVAADPRWAFETTPGTSRAGSCRKSRRLQVDQPAWKSIGNGIETMSQGNTDAEPLKGSSNGQLQRYFYGLAKTFRLKKY